MGMLMLMGDSGFNVRSELFGAGEQGAWYDPSDFSTMWQDSGKTTPVTAAGDPVGYIADKSGRGNDARQTTSGQRPTLQTTGGLWYLSFDGSDDSLVTNSISFNTWTQGTRRNLLTDTESFGVSTWVKADATFTDNVAASPVGANAATRLTDNASVSVHNARQVPTGNPAGKTFVASIYAKAETLTAIRLVIQTSVNNVGFASFDLANGLANAGTTGDYTNATATITADPDLAGWYRCSLKCTVGADTSWSASYGVMVRSEKPYGTHVYSGTSETVLISGIQFEEAATLTDYQRVGTDEMTVIAGVRKLSDAATGMVAELSAIASSSNGSFNFLAPRANGEASYAFTVNGGGSVNLRSYTGLSAPRTDVVSALLATTAADSAAAVSTRLNGVALTGTDVLSASASGNFGNYVLNIGRRNQTSIPYNGHIYQLIIRGNTTPTGKLLEAERFVARKTGVTF